MSFFYWIIAGISSFFCLFLVAVYFDSKPTYIKDQVYPLRGRKIFIVPLPSGEYRYQYFARSKNSPASLGVWVAANSNANFKITRETQTDSFFKKIGVAIEMQTGDHDFDSKFYISSDFPEFIRSYFSNAEKRQAVRCIFEHGFSEIVFNGKEMKIKQAPFEGEKFLDPSILEAPLACLRTLSENLLSYPTGDTSFVFLWKIKKYALFFVSIMTLITGMLTIIWSEISFNALDSLSLFRDSLKYSVPIFILFSIISLMLLKGKSASHHVLMSVLIIALIACPLAGYGVEQMCNGKFDLEPAKRHTALIVDKYRRRHKNSTSYYAVLMSWRKNHATETFSISQSEYNRINPQRSHMTVETKLGKLGFEWVVSKHLESF